MKTRPSFHVLSYGKINFRVYSILLLITLLMKTAVAFGSPLPTGKSPEQIQTELEGLATTYLFLDIAVESGGNEFVEAREMVKKALAIYLKNTVPSVLKGGLERSMRNGFFPDMIDLFIGNQIVIESMFARALLVSYILEDIDMNRVFTDFHMPTEEQIEEAEEIIATEGFNKEGFVNAMILYKAKFINK